MELELVHIHLATLSVTAIFIIIADHDGFLYLVGKKRTLHIERVKRLHYTVLMGLTLMIVTGVLLFSDAWGELIFNPAFYVKMGMVIALIVNSVFIGKLMHIATIKPFTLLSPKERHSILASGAVSIMCWLGATMIGLVYL